MDTLKIGNKEFSPSITAREIETAVKKIADQINVDLAKKNPLFMVVLNGAFMFASDLFKFLNIPCEISFVKLSSYAGTQSTSTVREIIGLNRQIKNRHVVVVEDIIDTGLTVAYTTNLLKNLGAAETRIATLLFKPDAFREKYKIDYVGLEIPDKFIVGYGLDYEEKGRNLPEIYTIVE